MLDSYLSNCMIAAIFYIVSDDYGFEEAVLRKEDVIDASYYEAPDTYYEASPVTLRSLIPT